MKRFNLPYSHCLIAFFLLLLLAPSVYSEKGEDPYKKAVRLHSEGRYGDALTSAKEALAAAEKQHGPGALELAPQLTLLADIHQRRGEWQDASSVLERLRSLQEAAWGPRDTKLAKTISALIGLYEKQGDVQRAEQLNKLASARWGGQEDRNLNNMAPVGQPVDAPLDQGPLLAKWNRLSGLPNFSKVTLLLTDYHKQHKYSKEDFFVCSDMAIEVWDIIKTAGINARIMVGNVEKDIVSDKSTPDYIAEMNHVWVMAEIARSEWVPLDPTAGMIVHPQMPNFKLYLYGTHFDTPRQFKEFSEARKALFQTCKEAHTMVTDFNTVYAGKPVTHEALERTGRTKQKLEDCANLEREVLSCLRN
jgi:hypothetical protein